MGLFVKVGTTQELDALEAGKFVEASGQRIAIFNLGGKYWAIEDTCPHRGGPLSEACWRRMRSFARGTAPAST